MQVTSGWVPMYKEVPPEDTAIRDSFSAAINPVHGAHLGMCIVVLSVLSELTGPCKVPTNGESVEN